MDEILYYSVAHYFDVSSERRNNIYKNIDNHIEQFLNIKEERKEFILISSVDKPRGDIYYQNVKEKLLNYCKQKIKNHPVHIITYYNWGGTIAALWECYKYLNNLSKNGFVAHFEEDFGPRNNKWYPSSKKLLKEDIIYVGESTIGRIKEHNDNNRLTYPLFKNHPRLGDPEVWTDGGFYFSSVKKLRIIDSKIGCFHKGNQNIKYVNILDGISIGEVGFPTLLYHKNLKFDVLNRSKYFINEWNN